MGHAQPLASTCSGVAAVQAMEGVMDLAREVSPGKDWEEHLVAAVLVGAVGVDAVTVREGVGLVAAVVEPFQLEGVSQHRREGSFSSQTCNPIWFLRTPTLCVCIGQTS